MWAAKGSRMCSWVFGIMWGFQMVLLAWGLPRAPLCRFSPPQLEPLGSCGIGGEGRTCLVALFSLPPRCPFTAASLGVVQCEASAVVCLLQVGI